MLVEVLDIQPRIAFALEHKASHLQDSPTSLRFSRLGDMVECGNCAPPTSRECVEVLLRVSVVTKVGH
jgi:hypothetical protein